MSRTQWGPVNYDKVLVWRKKFAFFQPADRAMSPNGNMYFNPKGDLYRDDFSLEGDVALRGVFVHELVHIWQYQHGVDVIARGLLERTYDYLPLVPGKPFSAYNIEQQGNIVMDYYYETQGFRTKGTPDISVYRNLIPFLPKK